MKFQPGSPGRLFGTRNRINKGVLDDILAEWREGGRAAVRTMRLEDPSMFVLVAVSILPKELIVENVMSDAADDLIEVLIAEGKKLLAERTTAPILIEAQAEEIKVKNETQ